MKKNLSTIAFLALFLVLSGGAFAVAGIQKAKESIEWGWGEFNPPRSGVMAGWQTYKEPQNFPELVFENEWTNRDFLSEYEGQFVLLNFWATWCAPCVQELPSLDRLQEKVQFENIKVMAFSLNEGQADLVSNFYEEHGIENLDVMVEMQNSSRFVDMAGLPTTILLDPYGNEVGRFEGGAEWDTPEVLETIGYYVNLWNSLKPARIAHCEAMKADSLSGDRIQCEE